MKTIGMIGGMSWESSLEYYRLVNEGIKTRLGGLHSAKVLMYSVDFDEIEVQQREGRWDDSARLLAEAARRLEAGGADFFLICTNTMHKVAPEVRAAVNIPLVHIADAAAGEISRLGLARVGLLGTRFTMEQDFMKGYLADRHGLNVLTPDETARGLVHDIIYDELCLGRVLDESRQKLLGVIQDLKQQGAQGVILGCTELPLLVKASDTDLPLLDTTALHARMAVDTALAND